MTWSSLHRKVDQSDMVSSIRGISKEPSATLDCRKTFALMICVTPMPVCSLLKVLTLVRYGTYGLSSITVTLDRYGHLFPKLEAKLDAALDRAGKSSRAKAVAASGSQVGTVMLYPLGRSGRDS